jgi:multidrug efflux pump subunit AcrB
LSLVLGLLVSLSFLLLGFQPKVFMPQFDQGRFILRMDLPVGTRLEITNGVMEKVERKLKENPAVTDVSVAVGSNNSDSGGRADVLSGSGDRESRPPPHVHR